MPLPVYTQLYVSFDPTAPDGLVNALSKLQNCITDIKNWMCVNKLKLNDSKTEFFIAASDYYQRQLPDITFTIGDSCIKPSQTIRNLGDHLFDFNMSMAAHITNLSRTITFHLRNITRIRRFIDNDTCHHAVRSLVLSRLDYCNGLFFCTKITYPSLTTSSKLGSKNHFYCGQTTWIFSFVKKSPLASSETKNYLQVTTICLQSIEWSCTYVYI